MVVAGRDGETPLPHLLQAIRAQRSADEEQPKKPVLNRKQLTAQKAKEWRQQQLAESAKQARQRQQQEQVRLLAWRSFHFILFALLLAQFYT